MIYLITLLAMSALDTSAHLKQQYPFVEVKDMIHRSDQINLKWISFTNNGEDFRCETSVTSVDEECECGTYKLENAAGRYWLYGKPVSIQPAKTKPVTIDDLSKYIINNVVVICACTDVMGRTSLHRTEVATNKIFDQLTTGQSMDATAQLFPSYVKEDVEGNLIMLEDGHWIDRIPGDERKPREQVFSIDKKGFYGMYLWDTQRSEYVLHGEQKALDESRCQNNRVIVPPMDESVISDVSNTIPALFFFFFETLVRISPCQTKEAGEEAGAEVQVNKIDND